MNFFRIFKRDKDREIKKLEESVLILEQSNKEIAKQRDEAMALNRKLAEQLADAKARLQRNAKHRKYRKQS